MTVRVAKVGTLRDQIGTAEPREVMFCPSHPEETYSANAGDYWDTRLDHVFTCRVCGGTMMVGVPVTTVTFH